MPAAACALALAIVAHGRPAGVVAEPPRPPEPGPVLLVPARPDSAPAESEPAPLLVPGRPSAADSARRSRPQRARDAYALGFQLEADGIHGAAIAAYQNAVRYDPTLPEANYRMGVLFMGRDQFAEAARRLEAELEHHPAHDEANRLLGICLVRLGDLDRGIPHLERLAKRRPRDAAVWHALGSGYLAAGRSRDAESTLRRSLRLTPGAPEVLRDLGATLAALGRDAEARVHYRRALTMAPTDAPTWLNLGNLERRAGHPDSALACYRRAEAGDSTLALALQAQVQILSEARRGPEAAAAYRRWLRHHPDHHGARLEAVRLLEELGRADEALAVALEGTSRAGDTGQPYVILGMLLRGRGDTRGALAALRQAETLYRTNPDERERVRMTIDALQAPAGDSLRALFAADSVEAARAGPR